MLRKLLKSQSSTLPHIVDVVTATVPQEVAAYIRQAYIDCKTPEDYSILTDDLSSFIDLYDQRLNLKQNIKLP
jgi:hypothetical protein